VAKRVIFIGSKQLGLTALETIRAIAPDSLHMAVTCDDRSDDRSVLDGFRSYCHDHRLILEVLKRPRCLTDIIAAERPDLCLVVGWYWLLDHHLLDLVPDGFIGVHASMLPRYRGGAPLVWTLINGDQVGGITLFHFDTGMDTGDIVAQREFSLDLNDTIADALRKAELSLKELLRESYPAVLNGTAPRLPQQHELASYCAQRRPEDGRINWNQSDREIHNFIRAQSKPYPGAFCPLDDGRILRIWRSRPFDYEYYGPPGKVVQKNSSGVIVTCGSGAVVLKEVQVDSNPPLAAAKVLKQGACLQ
jgi:methionyl-tRNA formyltransferase